MNPERIAKILAFVIAFGLIVIFVSKNDGMSIWGILGYLTLMCVVFSFVGVWTLRIGRHLMGHGETRKLKGKGVR